MKLQAPILKYLWDKRKISTLRFQNLAILPEKEMYLSLFKEGYIHKSQVPHEYLHNDNLAFEASYINVSENKPKQSKPSPTVETSNHSSAQAKSENGNAMNTKTEDSYQSNDEEEYDYDDYDYDYDDFDEEMDEYEEEIDSSGKRIRKVPFNYHVREHVEDEEYPDYFDQADPFLQSFFEDGSMSAQTFERMSSLSPYDMYWALADEGFIYELQIPSQYRD